MDRFNKPNGEIIMTVNELIEILKTFDSNLTVYTEDCEGWNEIRKEYIRLNEEGDVLISQYDSHGNC